MHRAHYTNLIAQGFDAYSSLVYAQHDEHIHQRFVVEIEQSYKNYPRRRNRRPVAVLVAAYNSPLLQRTRFWMATLKRFSCWLCRSASGRHLSF
jgi:hypothetical protein